MSQLLKTKVILLCYKTLDLFCPTALNLVADIQPLIPYSLLPSKPSFNSTLYFHEITLLSSMYE